ncbi:hypothetical protein Tco_1427424 [Tanacetum coccineum]
MPEQPTRFNISRRGMDIDSIVCPICNAGVESTNQIFFHACSDTDYAKISSWWNIDYSDVNSYEEWQVWLVSIRIQSKLKGVLEVYNNGFVGGICGTYPQQASV